MQRLPDFDLYTPETVEAAIDLLTEHGRDAIPVAGGTDVYPKMKRRQFTHPVVVSLGSIEGLTDIEQTADGGLRIGGLVTLADIVAADHVSANYRALAAAAEAVATPNHRRMGTIAGNLCQDTRCHYYDQRRDWRDSLGWCRKAPDEAGFPPDSDTIDEVPCRTVPGSGRCWATFASDTAPALIALDAEITVAGPDGARQLPLAEFYVDDGIAPHDLEDDELITEIRLPPADTVQSTYRKYSQRDAFDFPSVGVAAAASRNDSGIVDEVRVVLGAVSTHPVVVTEIPELLEGERPDADTISVAGQKAKRAARPMDNNDVSPAQRNQIAGIYTERALETVLDTPST